VHSCVQFSSLSCEHAPNHTVQDEKKPCIMIDSQPVSQPQIASVVRAFSPPSRQRYCANLLMVSGTT
jgi:hypothetical protein